MMGVNTYNAFNLPGFGNVPPPPMSTAMIPQQINRNKKTAYDIYTTVAAQPAVVSAKPTIYNSSKVVQAASANVDFLSLQSEVERKLKKLKNEKVSAELAISQGNMPIIETQHYMYHPIYYLQEKLVVPYNHLDLMIIREGVKIRKFVD